MSRAIVLVLDSFGIGSTPDAERFGDVGADTLGHIAEACAKAERGPLRLPNLAGLGLGEAYKLAGGAEIQSLAPHGAVHGAYGAAREVSNGKDTPSGHWEMMGAPVRFDWGYFPNEVPAFPAVLTEALIKRCNLPGLLGNCHASGTDILTKLGDEHVSTGQPIVYTSVDSVFQIAAHEGTFGLDRLYEVCEAARDLVDSYNIGRVIARPFVGENGNYSRTGNRKDYSVLPPSPTLLDRLKAHGADVIAIGKIGDIFAHQGTTQEIKADGNKALFAETVRAIKTAKNGSLIFTNFVDFDSLYGHRRDVFGYAAALEEFDQHLPELIHQLKPEDVVIITADHGCDPTWRGTDHTREWVPILAFGKSVQARSLGQRDTFADIAQTIARHLGVEPMDEGHAFLP